MLNLYRLKAKWLDRIFSFISANTDEPPHVGGRTVVFFTIKLQQPEGQNEFLKRKSTP
jgi:hypothetical protein